MFDLDSWKTLKQVYRKLLCGKKVFEKFQGQPHFPRKMILYSSGKFGIFNPCTNIQSYLSK